MLRGMVVVLDDELRFEPAPELLEEDFVLGGLDLTMTYADTQWPISVADVASATTKQI
jgi:hypothetical protein